MFLQRTPKAQQELAPGQRQLNQRQRSVLLMAERHPLPELQALFNGQGAAVVQELLAQGYLQAPSIAPPPAPSMAPPAPNASAAAPAPVSLAGARMHLFDLCERMFANRLPETAEHLRQMLREARDLPSMLLVREAFLTAMEQHAGTERAEALRRQLNAVFPTPTPVSEDCTV